MRAHLLSVVCLLGTGCFSRHSADPAVFARSTSLAVVSVQGPRAVRVVTQGSRSGTTGADAMVDGIFNIAANISASRNEYAVPLLDEMVPWIAERTAQVLRLQAVPQQAVAAVPVPALTGFMASQYVDDNHAGAGTHLVVFSRETGQSVGNVARTANADLGLWVELKCSVEKVSAHGEARLLVGHVTGETVGKADGEADVPLNALLRSIGVNGTNEEVARGLCGPAMRAAYDDALEDLRSDADR